MVVPLLQSPTSSPSLLANLNTDFNAKVFTPMLLDDSPKKRLNVLAKPFYPDMKNINNSANGNENSNILALSTNEAIIDMPNKTNEDSAYSMLTDIRIRIAKRIILGRLNINSIRNKFEMLADLVIKKIDILLISETKIDDSFTSSQFYIPGYSPPFRSDRSARGGGILLYVRADIPSKLLHCSFCNEIECLLIEINISKKKWLVYGLYNPNKSFISSHLLALSKSINVYTHVYDHFILMGDFNCEISDSNMNEFCNSYNLKSC